MRDESGLAAKRQSRTEVSTAIARAAFLEGFASRRPAPSACVCVCVCVFRFVLHRAFSERPGSGGINKQHTKPRCVRATRRPARWPRPWPPRRGASAQRPPQTWTTTTTTTPRRRRSRASTRSGTTGSSTGSTTTRSSRAPRSSRSSRPTRPRRVCDPPPPPPRAKKHAPIPGDPGVARHSGRPSKPNQQKRGGNQRWCVRALRLDVRTNIVIFAGSPFRTTLHRLLRRGDRGVLRRARLALHVPLRSTSRPVKHACCFYMPAAQWGVAMGFHWGGALR